MSFLFTRLFLQPAHPLVAYVYFTSISNHKSPMPKTIMTNKELSCRWHYMTKILIVRCKPAPSTTQNFVQSSTPVQAAEASVTQTLIKQTNDHTKNKHKQRVWPTLHHIAVNDKEEKKNKKICNPKK